MTFPCHDQVYLITSRFWCGETTLDHPILPSLLFLLICLQTALSCGGQPHDQGSCTVYAQRWCISQAVFLTSHHTALTQDSRALEEAMDFLCRDQWNLSKIVFSVISYSPDFIMILHRCHGKCNITDRGLVELLNLAVKCITLRYGRIERSALASNQCSLTLQSV